MNHIPCGATSGALMHNGLFASESVSDGHPDKIADRISDAVLDALISLDSRCRVACETLIKNGLVLIAGEITTNAWVDVEAIARRVIKDVGYVNPQLGFDYESCAVLTSIGKQSVDISRGVNQENQILGAGDQGLVFGYATDETDALMPAPIVLAHRLMQQHKTVRQSGQFPWLRPDAKSQVSLHYECGKPTVVHSLVLSIQHDPDIATSVLHEVAMECIIKPAIPAHWLAPKTHYYINPTGRFVIGGPVADCGLTGRKIVVDSYGGAARHGGGCFSGKDPSKVDRSGAYMARYVAKHLVALGFVTRCEVQIAYAIGVVHPVSVCIETFGTHTIPVSELHAWVTNHFDLSPQGMITTLDLLRPIYERTASYGHFGRTDVLFPWEAINTNPLFPKKHF